MKYVFLALAFAGCASGAPCSVAPAARVSVAPVQTLGFRPEVATVAKMPVEVVECVGGTCKAVFDDIVQGAKCVIDSLLPTVVPATSAPQYAPAAPCLPAAPLPKVGPCGR